MAFKKTKTKAKVKAINATQEVVESCECHGCGECGCVARGCMKEYVYRPDRVGMLLDMEVWEGALLCIMLL